MDKKPPTNRNRLSEPTFRHANLARSESNDLDNREEGSSRSYNKAASLDCKAQSSTRALCGVPQSSKGGCGVKRVKCVFVGDARVGKTSLIVSYTTNGYPLEYTPTAFDNFSVLVMVNSHPVQLQLCDTAGQGGFDDLRPLCYPNTDLFALCFSVVEPESFYHLHSKWLPEVRRHCPLARLLLVGTQSDRRTNVSTILKLKSFGETVVTENEAREYGQEIQALQYVECSALTQCNLKAVFDACILASLNMPFDRTGLAKSRIEKPKNQQCREFTKNAPNFHVRKSFRNLKEKMKRSNSVDSTKYTSVQVRRQLSSGRINHCGVNDHPVTSETRISVDFDPRLGLKFDPKLASGQMTSSSKIKKSSRANCYIDEMACSEKKSIPNNDDTTRLIGKKKKLIKSGSDFGQYGKNDAESASKKSHDLNRLKKEVSKSQQTGNFKNIPVDAI